MADLFEKPMDAAKAPTPSATEPVVHAMPKEYRGGIAAAPKKAVAPIAPVAPPKPIPVPQPIAQAMVPEAAKIAPPQAASKLPYLLILLVVLFLAGSGGVAYYLSKQSAPKPAPVVVPPTTSAPTPTPPPAPEPVPEAPKKIEAGIDSDADGLSDTEELRLYGTSVFNPDTDRDSFLDGNEVFHLYSPVTGDFARLADSGLVKMYASPAKTFSLFVPSSFVANEMDGGLTVTWSIPSGENMKLTVMPNPDKTELRSFFAAKFPERSAEVLTDFTTKSGLSGIQNADRLDTFVDGKDGTVYRLEYLIGPARAIDYRSTYNMMLNSLTVSR